MTRAPGLRARAARPLPAGHVPLRVGGRRGASVLVHRRAVLTAAGLALVLAAACLAYLCAGESFTPPREALRVLLGRPSASELVVGTLRLPRLAVGLLVGAAFGTAGALIQTVARNPLASPDVIGVSQGASAAAVGALTAGADPAALPYVSVTGGLAAALLGYLLAWRRGLHATRFVLIGIAVAIALRSVTSLLMTKGDYQAAQQAQVWLTGSLSGRTWSSAAPLGWTLLALVPAVVWASRGQRTAVLDDDRARALGARPDGVRLGMALLGVVLASVATGAAGPVDFVALLSPQIARRLARTAQLPLLCSALTGAVITVLADLLARTAFSPTELPVGVLTAAVGAPYLVWLLVARGRSGALT